MTPVPSLRGLSCGFHPIQVQYTHMTTASSTSRKKEASRFLTTLATLQASTNTHVRVYDFLPSIVPLNLRVRHYFFLSGCFEATSSSLQCFLQGPYVLITKLSSTSTALHYSYPTGLYLEVRCEGRAKTHKIHRFVRKSKYLLGSSVFRDLLTLTQRYTVGFQ